MSELQECTALLRSEADRIIRGVVGQLDADTQAMVARRLEQGQSIATVCDGEGLAVVLMADGKVVGRLFTLAANGKAHIFSLREKH